MYHDNRNCKIKPAEDCNWQVQKQKQVRFGQNRGCYKVSIIPSVVCKIGVQDHVFANLK